MKTPSLLTPSPSSLPHQEFLSPPTPVQKVALSKICGHCNTEHCQLRCGGCKIVYYCNKKCQTTSWPTHKLICQAASTILPSPTPKIPLPDFSSPKTAIVNGNKIQYFSIPEKTPYKGLHFVYNQAAEIGHEFIHDEVQRLRVAAQSSGQDKIISELLINWLIDKPFIQIQRKCEEAKLKCPPQLPTQLKEIFKSFFIQQGPYLPLDFQDLPSFQKSYLKMMSNLMAYVVDNVEMFIPNTSRVPLQTFLDAAPPNSPLHNFPSNTFIINCLGFVLLMKEEMDHLEHEGMPDVDYFFRLNYENVTSWQPGDVVVYFKKPQGKMTHAGICRQDGFIDSKLGDICPSIFSLHLYDFALAYGLYFAFFRKKPI
jgi:hypothetical protein